MATLKQLNEKFDKVVSHIKREGIDDLIKWLKEDTDFFSAPASTRFHGNYDGGLLEHSLHVVEFALTTFNYLIKYKPNLENIKESVIIAALFHDVCKVNQYEWGEEKWTKIPNGKGGERWGSYKGYKFNDKLPMGHGEKSVYYVSKFLQLTTSEILAIRWHMGYSEPGTSIDGLTKYAYQQASADPLVQIIHSADVISVLASESIDYKALAK
jgi:HD superfamily phosphohydrolase YqeK